MGERMRNLLIIFAVVILLSGCAQQQQPAQTAQAGDPAAPQYITTATVKDIMDGVVDPSADFIWESVATIVSAEGVTERKPRTDEEWAEVRRNAIRLLEATNLLMIPGRHIARPGQKAEDPKIELTPEKIEEAVNKDRASWNNFAKGLHEATLAAFNAVEKKDSEELLLTGDGIDQACEKCHLLYWYPDDAARQNAQAEGLSQQK
jgi:hypothetical protein